MARKKVKKLAKKSPKAKPAKTSSLWFIFVIAILILAGIIVVHKMSIPPPPVSPATVPQISSRVMPFDFGDQTYLLNSQEIHFVSNSYQSSDTTNGLHTAITLNRNVSPSGARAAAVLVDSPGGSGTFSYIVGAMLKDGKETYSEPVLLGDRVKIVSVSVADAGSEDNGLITVQYLDRPANVPMADAPTVPLTAKYAFQDDGNLIIVLH